mmetsp:Transcript_23073/g.20022  ORF Transcript_23073/g.20022 Transcript_23073/m.20022 type:complete len:91 (-) Transcript_23073:180-452(-)|eukprot:CAMPEP_0114579048 /NCGR_PEP_ID=MMETSP0125-20121206/3502_1 /TAXON_ID=485358 ORGANISM="Aristerostoma sp., Strain ATCC 50986" /NCGR_SAMPLE_ID=MMETSP0125 /ASSEMBLY_ACC=CAM_ASM_000245 /LENGTH=90 /DNA_ID=CAMNT_0001769557 /DNA_START=62 /DNA_END=334 /DNA_ORIENTATION=+
MTTLFAEGIISTSSESPKCIRELLEIKKTPAEPLPMSLQIQRRAELLAQLAPATEADDSDAGLPILVLPSDSQEMGKMLKKPKKVVLRQH